MGQKNDMKVAFLGTGLIGSGMAERLLEVGFGVQVYNRTRAKAEKLERFGAVVAETPLDAVRACDVVVMMLTDFSAITEVLLTPEVLPELKGKMIFQMGTISPEQSRACEARVEAVGAAYLEGPVLGNPGHARAGELMFMVGGKQELFEAWKPFLDHMGNRVEYFGGTGSGAATKLAMNLLLGSLVTSFSMSIGIVQGENLDLEQFMDLLRESALYAPTYDKKLERFLKRDFSNPSFPVRHMLKDLSLARAEADHLGLNDAGLKGVETLLQAAIDNGWADVDYSGVYNAINPEI
ncbi:MAG: NAD(P)-dependent oxidoreductase [Anaerolineales bacterium]|nr:NAD(P)-dependent oxidoreductase [Anaerolineales bacterium]